MEKRDVTLTLVEDGLYVIEKEDQSPIGTISLKDYGENGWQMFLEIQKPFRNMGYGSAALRKLHELAEKEHITDEIHAVISDEDAVSKHLLEHHGYQLQLKHTHLLYYVHRKQTCQNETREENKGWKTLYLAGGCFWGLEKAMKLLDGVKKTETGYVNGHTENPNYESVCAGDSGYKECVKVSYDPAVISTKTILQAYFLCIDPTVSNRQGNDIGEQYQTGIYYKDPEVEKEARQVYEVEKQKHHPFCVEFGPCSLFYPAEEYHQNDLEKHPDGYCHITPGMFDAVKKLNEKERDAH